ncbi:MAG TPA: hypothetical protein VM100_12825, partial [Longimicrobiales bacterium]|nr:hypothetical protein [Longimicrobiales bacterium]
PCYDEPPVRPFGRAGVAFGMLRIEDESMNRMRILATTLACCALSACYNQKPLDTVPPPPAARIRAQLSDSGTVAMSNALGAGVIAFEAVVEQADPNVWQMRMVSASQKDGRVIDWNRELVSFPARVIVEPQVRILDKKKSWIAAVGLTVGAFLAARAFNVIGTDEATDDTTDPAQSVIGVRGK